MKAKTSIFAFSLLLVTLLSPAKSYAQELASGESATLHTLVVQAANDNRADILKRYLQQFNSPLAEHAQTFVDQADLYQLDWRFVAAIAGRESTFAKEEPCINPFGYGVFGDQTLCFTSYDDAIHTVSKALREKYMNQWGAQTLWDIGKMYAASPTWTSGVIYFMNDMENFALNQPVPLPISL